MTAGLALIAGLFVGFTGGWLAAWVIAAANEVDAAGKREPERNP